MAKKKKQKKKKKKRGLDGFGWAKNPAREKRIQERAESNLAQIEKSEAIFRETSSAWLRLTTDLLRLLRKIEGGDLGLDDENRAVLCRQITRCFEKVTRVQSQMERRLITARKATKSGDGDPRRLATAEDRRRRPRRGYGAKLIPDGSTVLGGHGGPKEGSHGSSRHK